MNQLNKQDIKEIIYNFPSQFKVGLEASAHIKSKRKFENVIVSGMGGSAWPSDVLKTWLTLKIPFLVNRTYNLPLEASSKTLAVFSSYSGNTEEPLYSYKEALARKMFATGITSGGRLEKFCKRDKTFLASIPANLQPRMATGYLFSALYSLLVNLKLTKDRSAEILEMAKKLDIRELEKEGQRIAKRIFRKIPIIYMPDKFKAIGYVLKIKFNENTKIPAFCNYFSEINHNEMSGWQIPLGKFFVVMFRDLDDHPRMLKRIELTSKLIQSEKVEVEIIDMKGKNTLEKIFNTILIGEWASYYLALKYKVNPIEIKFVDKLKKDLRK